MGRAHLEEATPYAGADWTNDGQQRDQRQLKNRARGEGRTVPIPPELTALLHEHIAAYRTGSGWPAVLPLEQRSVQNDESPA